MAKRRRILLLGLVGCASTVALMRGGCSPESRLASHLDELTAIMERHLERPAVGVTTLFDHLQDELPDLLRQTGRLLADLDGIEDDEERAERAEEMVAHLKQPLHRHLRAADRFWQRVDQDPVARDRLKRRLDRLEGLKDLFEDLTRRLPGLG